MFLISNIENIIDNIEHKVTFGKYKGQTIEDICKYERDASWVYGLINKLNGLILTHQ